MHNNALLAIQSIFMLAPICPPVSHSKGFQKWFLQCTFNLVCKLGVKPAKYLNTVYSQPWFQITKLSIVFNSYFCHKAQYFQHIFSFVFCPSAFQS